MASRKGDLLRRVEKAPLIGRRSAVIYSLALVLVALAGACSAASDVGSDAAVLDSRMSLHLEQVYGTDTAPADAILGEIGGAAIGRNGDIYVLDTSVNRLVAFDGKGSVRWVAGSPGSGPGDFSNEGPLTFDGGSTLYVSNRGGSTVDSWDIDGGYRGTYSVGTVLDRRARVAGFIEPSYLVLVASLGERPGNLLFVVDVGNDDWELASRFEVAAGPKELPEYAVLRARPAVGVANDSILVGNYGIYEAKVYDSAGSLLRVFSRELGTLEMPRTVNTPSTPGRGFSSMRPPTGALFPPLPLADGYWITQVSWPREGTDYGEIARQWLDDPSLDVPPVQMMNSVDVFDSSGDLVSSAVTEGEFPAEDIFGGVGADMRLYAFGWDPFPQVRRYRVEIER